MYHKQRWTSEKIKLRLELITPLIYIKRKPLPSLTSTSSPNVILETIKRAEDGDGIIVRLYESQRKRGPVQLHAGFAIESAWETNLLEEKESELNVENDSVQLDLSPYQIMTLRLKPK